MTKPVYLVDASIYIFRAYFSLPDQWHAPNGYPVNALLGYVAFWIKFLQVAQPDKVVAAYDESLGSCFRNDLYTDYKKRRVLPDEALAFQLEACKGFTEIMGIPSPASSYYEADDILATLAAMAQKRAEPIVVVSRDKDLAQLLKNSRDLFWDFAADNRLDQHGIARQFGVQPEQLADYLALVGDGIDDIPGVPGIGAKTAAALLREFGDIDTLYNALEQVSLSRVRGAASVAAKLAAHREQVMLSRQLTTLYPRVPLDRKTRSMRWQPPSLERVSYYLEEFGVGGRFARQLQLCEWWN